MTYKSNLSTEELEKWNNFKKSIEADRSEGIFKNSAFLGKCDVQMSFIEGELFLEILPFQTADLMGDTTGIIVKVNEDKCHVDHLLDMVSNADAVKVAKENGASIKEFTNTGGAKIHTRSSDDNMKTNQESETSKAIEELDNAWNEMTKFGEHEGQCNFRDECPECNQPLGGCDKHAETMQQRIERMNVAVDNVKNCLS